MATPPLLPCTGAAQRRLGPSFDHSNPLSSELPLRCGPRQPGHVGVGLAAVSFFRPAVSSPASALYAVTPAAPPTTLTATKTSAATFSFAMIIILRAPCVR